MLFLILNANAFGAESVIRVNLDAALNQLDPIWTTSYIVRSHGFMVYDTLFGLDENFNVQPQMVDSYKISEDGLNYSFTLRDGLKWHDGTPVTSRDCVASIKRWGSKDGMGQQLMAAVDSMTVVDDKTFTISLKHPFGMLLQSLAKITANVPFMMKEAQALTSADDQISEVIGSGPFRFVREAFEPGTRAIYVKNEDYVPRREPASNTAGGKVVKVDKVEIIWIPDLSTRTNALISGEIDFIEAPHTDHVAKLRRAENVRVEKFDTLGYQCVLRLNHLQPPFNNVYARQAVLWATGMEMTLQVAAGNDPSLYRVCPSMYPCGTPFATDIGSEPLMKQDFAKAKALLEKSGYKGEKVIVLHGTGGSIVSTQTLVTGQNLRKAGFNVELIPMDWATLSARRKVKKPASEGGWNAFQTYFTGPDFLNPAEHMAIKADGEKSWFGWPEDKQIQELCDAFVAETDFGKQKTIAAKIQERAFEVVTYVPLGTIYQPAAYRAELKDLLKGPVPLFWNVHK